MGSRVIVAIYCFIYFFNVWNIFLKGVAKVGYLGAFWSDHGEE
jgi:hypothetical protein